jgi:hypothetical protein
MGFMPNGVFPKERRMEMKTLFECIVSVGLFIIIGTAGSTDLNAISLTQTILFVILGLVIMLIGLIGCKVAKKGR